MEDNQCTFHLLCPKIEAMIKMSWISTHGARLASSAILVGVCLLGFLILSNNKHADELKPLPLSLACENPYVISPQAFDSGQLPRTKVNLLLPSTWKVQTEISECSVLIQEQRSQVEVWINSASSVILPKYSVYATDSDLVNLKLADAVCIEGVCKRFGLIMQEEDVSAVLVASYIQGKTTERSVLSALRQVAKTIGEQSVE